MADRTTKRIPTGETLFLLAYGTEAIILIDICMPTLRTGEIEPDQNAIQLRLTQDQKRDDEKLRYALPPTSNKSRPLIIRK